MYEVVEFTEVRALPGTPPVQRLLGNFALAQDALEQGRAAWRATLEVGTDDYVWWVVKRQGAELAEWIADSRSAKEYVVDVRTGQLIQL